MYEVSTSCNAETIEDSAEYWASEEYPTMPAEEKLELFFGLNPENPLYDAFMQAVHGANAEATLTRAKDIIVAAYALRLKEGRV